MADQPRWENMADSERRSLIDQLRQSANEEGSGNTYTAQLNLDGGTRVGTSGTAYTEIKTSTVTLTAVPVGNATISSQNFLISGGLGSSTVFVNGPTFQGGLAIGGVRVANATTLTINYINTSAATITPTVGPYKIISFV